MRIIVKNKFISWGGSSSVEDESGKLLYRVKGKVFSFTRKKFVCDLSGKRLYTVRNKVFNFLLHSAYVNDANGNRLLKVKRSWSFKYDFNVTGISDDIRIEGTGLQSSRVIRNGELIGYIEKEFWALRDYFYVEVVKEEDVPFMVALVIAIDNIQDKAQKSSR